MDFNFKTKSLVIIVELLGQSGQTGKFFQLLPHMLKLSISLEFHPYGSLVRCKIGRTVISVAESN